MKTFSKLLGARVVAELLVLVILFVAFDRLTAPSKNTDAAVLEAVNKKQLEATATVEVSSAIRSAAFLRGALRIMSVLVLFLLCCDLWQLWRPGRSRVQ